MLLACWTVAVAAPDPIVAERGSDHITFSQAKALAEKADPRLLTDPPALKRFLTNILVQRALNQQAQNAHWAQRPEVAAMIMRAEEQVVAQSFLMAHATLPPGYPSDAEIAAAYAQNQAKLMQPRLYHLAQIFVATPPAGEARAKLVTLRAQLSGRVTFEELAGKLAGAHFSDLGWLAENQLLAEIKQEVTGLQVGAVSDPICTEAGCHLIKLVATRPAGPVPLEDARDSLVRALRQQKQTELENAYASSLLVKQPVAINEIELSRMAR